jgi:hypothetical protein
MKTYQSLIDMKTIDQPAWKDLVERWYQLDQASKVLCQALYVWNQAGAAFDQAHAIVYIFDQGSNQADFEFVQSQAISPAKFVYTLPSIPITLVQQMLKMSVSTYCLHIQPGVDQQIQDLVKALSHQYKNILVVQLQAPLSATPDLWNVEVKMIQGLQGERTL